MEMKCMVYATGTTKPGSHTKGKYAITVLTGSFIKTLNGSGVDKIAITKILSSKISPKTFHAMMNPFDNFFLKAK